MHKTIYACAPASALLALFLRHNLASRGILYQRVGCQSFFQICCCPTNHGAMMSQAEYVTTINLLGHPINTSGPPLLSVRAMKTMGAAKSKVGWVWFLAAPSVG